MTLCNHFVREGHNTVRIEIRECCFLGVISGVHMMTGVAFPVVVYGGLGGGGGVGVAK